MNDVNEAEVLFNQGLIDESLVLIDSQIADENVSLDAYLLRSRIYYKLQRWGDCLNDLNRILEFEPENTIAKNYKKMVLDIIRFWNKDSYNP